jgi:sulfide:quinone oxidoreductase
MKVVVIGGGVAGLEALMALRDLAEERVELTLVAPVPEFSYRPLTVMEPFTSQAIERRPLEPIAAEFGATFVQAALVKVAADAHSVHLSDGSTLDYDALAVCVGGKPISPYRKATTFDDSGKPLPIDDLIDAADGSRIAFVVPPGVTWPLPIYELALMTDRRARHRARVVECVVVTPESAPLIMFGATASDAVASLLEARAIRVETGVHARESEQGVIMLSPGDRQLDAPSVIALPFIEGHQIAGLPTDDKGFIPIDHHARVHDVDDVYAAGDGASFPIKQGGIATQQADALAEHIAERAGAPIEPKPFRPVLRGKLLTGQASLHMLHEPAGGGGEGTASEDCLWWPPHKVSGRYFAPWLAQSMPTEPEAPGQALDIEIAMPDGWSQDSTALDPYNPVVMRPR